jgi:hypothetical protein
MKSPISSDFNKINYHQQQQRQYQNVNLINEVLTSWVPPQKKKSINELLHHENQNFSRLMANG